MGSSQQPVLRIVWLALQLVTLVLIVQPMNVVLYYVGLGVLIVSLLIQMPVKRSLRVVVRDNLIILLIVGLLSVLVPGEIAALVIGAVLLLGSLLSQLSYRRPFAGVARDVLIVLLGTSLILMAQQHFFIVFQIGLLLLVSSALVNIPVGNIPPSTRFLPSLKLVGIGLAIVFAVFGIGVLIVPYLLRLGQG